jgi:hypothetical protein
MARFAAVLGLVVALAGALHWWRPFLTDQRAVVASTPSPGPRGAGIGIPLEPGGRLCVAPVTIDRASAKAQFTLSAAKPGPTRLVFETNGASYHSGAEVKTRLQRTPLPVEFAVGRPLRDVIGEMCVRNASRSRLSFVGASDPISIALTQTRIDGKPLTGQAAELELLEAHTHSVLGRLGTIVRHAADFTGNLMPFWLAWLLVVALVIGAPFAIFAGFWAALRSEPE